MGEIGATVIDLLGLLGYVGVLSQITNPPFGLTEQQLLLSGLAILLVAYTITWLRYREDFWTGFIVSIVIATVVLFAGLWAMMEGILPMLV